MQLDGSRCEWSKMELYVLVAVACPFFLLVFLKLYLTLTAGVCRSNNTLEGKVVIVTGANSGIGFETAKDLARRRARVILACRDLDKGRQAAEDIAAATGCSSDRVVVRHLDLSSLRSVRKFARGVVSSERRLDVLVHNAGMTPRPGRHLTRDGLEVQFATNYFGPFLLTHLLLDLMTKSAPSRIVVVSSVTHLWASLDLEDLKCEKGERDPYWVYCSTKLANVLFVRELAERLGGCGVTVNALHPGGVRTGIARNARWFIKYLIVPFIYPFLKDCRSGAQTSIHLAVSDEVKNVSGEYFVDCKTSWVSMRAKDKALAKGLWEISEKLTGL